MRARVLLPILLLTVMFVDSSFAQDVTTTTTTSWWQNIIAQIQAPLLAVTTAVIGTVTAIVGGYLTKYLGQKTSDALTQIFQTTATNAAAWIIGRIGMTAAKSLKPGDPILTQAVNSQMNVSIPGTLKKLGNPTEQLKADKVLAAVQKLAINDTTAKTMVAPAPTM